jgi:predicted ATPase
MKQRFEIRNFGPISNVDLDVSDYMVFIGPNAIGKSTIAKLIYFFHSLNFSGYDFNLSPENNNWRADIYEDAEECISDQFGSLKTVT